jgi:quercetin dioxygenase-like cupin family protein
MNAKSAEPCTPVVIVRRDETEQLAAFPGLTRTIMAHNDELMLTRHAMEKGSVFPRHSHPHVQLAYLLSGHIRVRCGELEFEAHAGDSFVIRGGVEHEVVALEESVALDVFTPRRDDYLGD